MKTITRMVFCLVILSFACPIFGQMPEAAFGQLTWSERELLRAGRRLSVGSTLTSPLKAVSGASIRTPQMRASAFTAFTNLTKPIVHAPQIPPPPKTMQDFGFDPVKIDQGALNNKIIEQVGRGLINQGFGLAGMGSAATSFGLLEAGVTIRKCWRVGSGEASPEILRSAMPHLIIPWDILKGPENVPKQTFRTRVNRYYDNGAWRIHTFETHRIRQEFHSTAPGYIGRWGYNPYTDRLLRQTDSHIIRHESFNGARFNKWYRNQQFNMPQMPLLPSKIKTYTPPPQIYTPPPIYRPPPSSR